METRTTISLARRSPEQNDLQAMIDEATRQYTARGGKVECVGFRMKDATVSLSYGRTGFAELVEIPRDPPLVAEPQAPAGAEAEAARSAVKPRLRVMAGVVRLHQPPACDAADSALADSLSVRSYYGDTLAAAARRLGESVTRCADVARRYDVHFKRAR